MLLIIILVQNSYVSEYTRLFVGETQLPYTKKKNTLL